MNCSKCLRLSYPLVCRRSLSALFIVLLGYKLNVEHHVGTAVPSVTSDSEKKGPVIMEIPLDKIRRPLMRTRANDPAKVQELMDSIRVIGLQVPVSICTVLSMKKRILSYSNFLMREPVHMNQFIMNLEVMLSTIPPPLIQ
jgi:hypothetical protein